LASPHNQEPPRRSRRLLHIPPARRYPREVSYPPPQQAQPRQIEIEPSQDSATERRSRSALYQRLALIPLAAPLDHQVATELVRGLGALERPLILEISASATKAGVGVICRSADAEAISRVARGLPLQVDIQREDRPIAPPLNSLRLVSTIGQSGRLDLQPLVTLAECSVDPLAQIFEAVQPLDRERLEIQLGLRRPGEQRAQILFDQLYQKLPPVDILDALARLFGRPPAYLPRYPNDLMKLFEDRLLEPLFEVLIAVSVIGPDTARLQSRTQSLEALFRHRFADGWAGLTLSPWRYSSASLLPALEGSSNQPWLLATSSELAAIYHLPSDQVRVPGARFGRRAEVVLPPALINARGLVLGLHRQRSEDIPVRLPMQDLQLGHAILLGKTRVGKTTLAHQLARQIKQALPHSRLIIFDPNRDWAIDFAARSVLPERLEQTYLLEFGDPDFPPSLPILTPPPGVSIDRFTKVTFETIKLIFRDQWSSTRMETIMFKTVASLVQLPGSTLLDVERLYTDARFRHQVASRVNDADLRDYWRGFDALSRGQQQQMTEPILNRLSIFTRSKAMRDITCRPERSFDLGGLIDEGADVLISTAGAEIHDEADLLVELLISRIHLALFSRLGTSTPRSPVFLAIDESQHVKGPSLPVLLSEAAKTGLTVIALSQYLDQWSEALAESILGNVGTTIVFAVGPNDSVKLARTLRPFTAADAEDLSRFEALVKLRLDGVSIPTFDIRTLPLTSAPDPAMLEQIRAQSRARFTLPASADSNQAAPDVETEDIYED
jgi:hypothetical protein